MWFEPLAKNVNKALIRATVVKEPLINSKDTVIASVARQSHAMESITWRLPDKIYVFYGDQIAYSGPPNVKRKDVTIWFKADHLIMSGFDFKLPAENVPENLERVTILASFPDNAVLEHVTLQR